MRIGILTFHCASNYGAVLQAFALQKYLTTLGHDVSVIDYRPEYLLTARKIFRPGLSLPKLVGQAVVWPKRRIRLNNFDRFIHQHLNLTENTYYSGDFAEERDAYILGSDQIWGEKITHGDRVFFGRFSRPAGAKLIAYSASAEVKTRGSGIDFSQYEKDLNEFSSISVREEILRKQIQARVKIEVATTVDPTLLIDPVQFSSIAFSIGLHGHLVNYQVIQDANTQVIADKIAYRYKISKELKFVNSVGGGSLLNPHASASPQEFLGAFMNAKYIVTTSFHGAIFSIIFKKPFVCVMSKSRGSYRISNLLEKLGLEDRMVYSSEEIPEESIDYDNVFKRWEVLRHASQQFLIRALA